MNENGINGSGSGYFKHLSPEAYKDKIVTPSGFEEYFQIFHQPTIDWAKQKFGSPIHLLDIACGPADELEFIKNDPSIKIIATDISRDILPYVKDRLGEKGSVFVSDANLPALKENIAEVGILVNALVYVPEKMLEAMYKALKPGGRCVVNCRIFSTSEEEESIVANPNLPIRQGVLAKVYKDYLTVKTKSGARIFPVRIADFSETIKEDASPDDAMRQLGRQLYFENVNDVRDLMRMEGFTIIKHSQFEYVTPYNTIISTDVFVLEKPLTA